MLGVLFALLALQSLSLERFFVVSLLGFLVLVQFVTPINVTPRWRRRLRWFVVLGLVVYGGLVVSYVLEILPSGLV